MLNLFHPLLPVSIFYSYNDEQLAKMLSGQNGRAAFEILYDRYWEKLLIHTRHMLGSEHEAEEAVQNVFMKIWKSRQKIDIRNTFYTYISTCVKYEIMAMLIRQKRQREADASRWFAGTDAEQHNNTQELMDYESTRKQLEATVLQLPEKCQLVFRLSREKGLSEKEIAVQMAISGKTVQAHMTKALKILRSNLHQVFFPLF